MNISLVIAVLASVLLLGLFLFRKRKKTTIQEEVNVSQRVIYMIEPCGGGEGPYAVTWGAGYLPAGTGQSFKIEINGNTKCWKVIDIKYNNEENIDIEWINFGEAFSNCEECK